MTYQVSEAQMADLNRLINKAGGENTSQISIKHESVVALANALPPTTPGALRQGIISKTESAQGNNEVVGATLQEMQVWHDNIAIVVQPPPNNPPAGVQLVNPFQRPDGMWECPPLMPNTDKWGIANAVVGVRYVVPLGAEVNTAGYSCPSGPCEAYLGTAAGGRDLGVGAGADNAQVAGPGPYPAGAWLTMVLQAGHSSGGTIAYSAHKYA